MKIAALHTCPAHVYAGHHGRAPGTEEMIPVDRVACVAGRGLRGDRYWDHRPGYAGQITFFAEEVHRGLLRALARTPYPPSAYRRNALTRGVDLNELIGREFEVQGVRFLGAVECKPCYWMDRAIGPGAEAWLRGRGGLRAQILKGGPLRVDCPTAAGALLAGGRSRRMGRDKARLDWQGRPLGEHQATTLFASGAWPLLLSCRRDQPWTPAGFTRVEDQADEGVLGALIGALRSAPSPVLTTLAIDLPRVPPELLQALADRAREAGVSAVPIHGGFYEPLAAAWHRSALPALAEALSGGRSLQHACAVLQAEGGLLGYSLDADEAAWFANLNTPADAARESIVADYRRTVAVSPHPIR